jgi:hypothetical protein
MGGFVPGALMGGSYDPYRKLAPQPSAILGTAGGTPAPAPAAPLVNTAPVNPDLKEVADNYKARIQQSQAAEKTQDPRLTDLYNKYNQRLSTDTTNRAIGRASLSIADQASGGQAVGAEAAAARGVSGTGVSADINARSQEAAQRRQAGAAADISLQRERDLDQLTLGGLGIAGAQGQMNLAQQGQTNSLYAGAPNVVGAPAQQNLQERNLNLNQYQTQANIDLQRQQAEQQRKQQEEEAWRNALSAVPSTPVPSGYQSGLGSRTTHF